MSEKQSGEKHVSAPKAAGSAQAPSSVPVTKPVTAEAPKASNAEASKSLSEKSPVSDDKEPANNEKRTTSYNRIALYQRLSVLRKQISVTGTVMNDNMDSSLGSIGYIALFLGAGLKDLQKLAALAPTLLNSKRASQIADSLLKLYELISEYRMVWRIWGTVATVDWAISCFENPSEDRFTRWATYVQGVAGVLYQVQEDLAYLAMKGVLPISDKTQTRLWIWSCIPWAVHVNLELLKLLRAKALGEKNLLKPAFVNLAWLPLTAHWSTEKGIFSPTQVGLLGALASVPGAFPHWRKLITG